MNEFKIKQRKEIPLPIIRFLICFLSVFGALLVICIWTSGKLLTVKHVLIFSLCSIPLCLLYAYTVEKLGSGLGGLFSGRSSKKISLREQLSADLEKARHSKRNGHFEESLNMINSVLDIDQDFPDALYIKAQILWEGFGKSVESKRLFRRVMQLVSTEHALHRWSSSYYDRITSEDKKRVAEFQPRED